MEGAFLNVLIAVAATARRRYPDRKAVGDRESFERFLETSHTVRLSVEYRGECYPVGHIFYKWFRCQLVHEGGLPVDIEFMPDDTPGSMSVRAGGEPEFVLKVSHGWFHHLVGAVVNAHEEKGVAVPVTRKRCCSACHQKVLQRKVLQCLSPDSRRNTTQIDLFC